MPGEDVPKPGSQNGNPISETTPFRPLRTYVVVFLLGMAPIVALGVYAYQISASAVGALVRDNNLTAIRITRELVEREFQQWVDGLNGFARNPDFRARVRDGDEEGVRERLGELVQSHPLVVRAFVTDPEGLLWSDYPKAPESLGRNFSHRDWFRGLSGLWAPYVSEVYQRHAEPRLLLVAIAAPVRAPGGDSVVGTVVYQVTLDGLTQSLRRVKVGESGFVFLVDHRGRLAAHPRLDLQARKYGEFADAAPVVQARQSDVSGVEYTDPLTGARMFASAISILVGGHRWVAVAQQVTDEAYRPLRGLAFSIGAAGLLLMVGAGGLFFGLARAHNRVDGLNRRLADVNDSLRERSRALEAANDELKAFSYSVSHDLRAPLRAMDGFSQALVEDYGDKLDATAEDYIGRIRAASQRMARLIDDILALSRITRREMEPGTVGISAIAEEIGGRLRETEPERRVAIDVAPELVAEADEGLARVVLENLIGNAWKFTRGNGDARIEIGAEDVDGARAFFIRDNGAGFDMAYADKLFQPFQRLHSDTEYEGTGIGLATAARAVHRHGGRIWADSEVGRGTTMHFTLGKP